MILSETKCSEESLIILISIFPDNADFKIEIIVYVNLILFLLVSNT